MRPLAFALLLLTAGCQSTYYAALEKVGIPKRDVLISRIEKARDSQVAAREEFADALERFRSVITVENAKELEDAYDDLRGELEDAEDRASEVRNRIAKVEDVAEALLSEWEEEIDDYTDRRLERRSQRQLAETKRRYAELMRAMRRAEARLDPALDPLRDQVRFLKHNLNAKALASISGELEGVEADVEAVLRDLQRSIEQADRFIRETDEA